MRTRLGFCLLSAWLGLGAAPARQEVLHIKRLAPTPQVKEDRSLEETIEKVKASFLARDSGKLEGCFGNAKIFVSLKSTGGKPGYYTSSQLLFMLDKLFRTVSTRTFEHAPHDLTIADDDRAFLRSQWTYVVLDSDTLVSENLHIAFVKQKEIWRIAEIKSSPR